MKNSADLGGCYPPRPSALVDNTLLDLQNSSYPTQPHSIIANYYMHLEITGDPCNLIGSQQCDLFPNRTIFCSKSHHFPSHWKRNTKTKQPIRFQGLFKVTNQITRKWKTKKPLCGEFCNFCYQLEKIKYWNWLKSCILVIKKLCDF